MSTLKDKYVNPLTDFGFKRLFGTEPNKELMIDFLNQLLPDRHQIVDLNYARNEQFPNRVDARKAVFDLYCVGENGERFIVEVQKAPQKFFKDRSVFYASFPIREQAIRGKWDFELQPVYTVGILNFTFDDSTDDEVVHYVELKDQECRVFYDKLKFIYLELPKFRKQEHELKTRFDKWMYVLRHLPDLQNRPRRLQEKVFKRLFDTAEIAKFTKKELAEYEESLKTFRDLTNVIDTATERGFERGIEQGIEQGREATKEQIARRLLRLGVTTDLIVEATGLTAEQIDAMRPG